MINRQLSRTAIALILFLFAAIAQAQSNGGDIYWHIDPKVKSCSMVIDPSLTQGQWHIFTEQAGALIAFKSLAPAKTLGKMNFIISINNSYTPVDQHNPAWINTFTHPDADCPLGDVISVPTIRASMGISDNMDIGGFWTTAPQANYGVVGGEFKYALMQESGKYPAAAVRGSMTLLTGVSDFNMNIYSVDLIASKSLYVFTPYIGFKTSLIVGTETTSKVDLKQESIPIAQGYAGVVYSVWLLNLAAEYNFSMVNTFAVAVGFNL